MGTIYRVLERMEHEGLLESEPEDAAEAEKARRPRRRLYKITEKGSGALSRARAKAPIRAAALRPREVAE